MKTATLAGIFALFGLGITFSFSLIKTGDIQNNIQINIGNQNSSQTTSDNKTNETKRSPFEAEYRADCREYKSKESCKMLAEELAKEKLLSQVCNHLHSQTHIKTGDQKSITKDLHRISRGSLQNITVLKEEFENQFYIYKVRADGASCN